MKKICLVALLVVLGVFVVSGVMAEDAAGAKELDLLNAILGGNIGFAIGLLVAVSGIFMLIGGNVGGGLIMVVLGVLVTLAPGVFNSARSLFCPMVSAMTGGEASCH